MPVLDGPDGPVVPFPRLLGAGGFEVLAPSFRRSVCSASRFKASCTPPEKALFSNTSRWQPALPERPWDKITTETSTKAIWKKKSTRSKQSHQHQKKTRMPPHCLEDRSLRLPGSPMPTVKMSSNTLKHTKNTNAADGEPPNPAIRRHPRSARIPKLMTIK